MRSSLIFLILFSLVAQAAEPPAQLSLSGYLDQVRKGHEGARGLEASSTAATALLHEARNSYALSLFAEGTLYDDSKRTMNPSFQGNRTIFDSFNVGVSKLTDFGMGLRLSYNTSYTSLLGTSPLFVPEPQFWEAKPMLEVSQSLWRNGFGKEIDAMVEAAEAQLQASIHGYAFQQALILAEAEGTYWRVQAARQAVEVQTESLARATKIREWSARRSNMELADKSDLYQSDAGVKFRELELQAAKDELDAAQRAFNSLRGVSEQKVLEILAPLTADVVMKLEAPVRKGERADVKAALEAKRAQHAQFKVGEEKNKPTLDVKGSIALNGRDPAASAAMGQSFGKDFPTWGVSLVFKTPLNLGELSDYREAYVRSREGAELQYRRKLFEQERDWNDLTEKWKEARNRFELASKLEEIQKTKLDHERDRLRRGQSVTYQVLLFEQDYLSAQMMRLRVMQEILAIQARLRVFGGES